MLRRLADRGFNLSVLSTLEATTSSHQIATTTPSSRPVALLHTTTCKRKEANKSNTITLPSDKLFNKPKTTVQQEDERIRQLLLDRDGGPASVPTREGKWDQEMGRETAKNMHRVLDQVRTDRPKEYGKGDKR